MEKKVPKLSERLAAVVSMVPTCAAAADIGCDHGYAAIWLTASGRCAFCAASDLRSGPLEKAAENADFYGVKDLISFRQGDGLSVLAPCEAETVIISGMGGLLIRDILKKNPETAKSVQAFVLSPQSDIPEVRKCLEELCFSITDEAVVFEDGKFYTVIKAENTPPKRLMTEEELLFGPALLEKRDAVFIRFLEHKKTILKDILADIKDTDTAKAGKRRGEVETELSLIEDILSGR